MRKRRRSKPTRLRDRSVTEHLPAGNFLTWNRASTEPDGRKKQSKNACRRGKHPYKED